MTKISKTSFGGLYGTSGATFPDNTTAEISEGDMRTFGNHIQDSVLFIDDHLLDEDDMASDSATKVPSQQSVKAYVDAQVAAASPESNTSISSAEILSSFTSPIELIPAPGAGKFIQILYGYIYLTAGTAYSNTTTQVQYGSGQTISGVLTNFLNTVSNTMVVLSSPSVATNGIAAATQFVNQNVEYAATASDPTTGTGTMVIKLVYRIVTL